MVYWLKLKAEAQMQTIGIDSLRDLKYIRDLKPPSTLLLCISGSYNTHGCCIAWPKIPDSDLTEK